MYKINLVALVVLVAVAFAFALAGVTTISRVSYDLKREVMSHKVNNVVTTIQGAYDVLVENRIDGVESYTRQAQRDVVDELKSFSYGKSGRLFIVTDRKKVVKHDYLTAGQPIDFEQITTMVHNRSGTMEFAYEGQRRFFSYKLFPQWNWLVILSVNSEEMLEARNQFLGKVVMIFLVSLVVGAIIFIWFIQRVVGPIRQLADATTFVSKGKWDAPLPQATGSDEVGLLTSAFRRMAKKLAQMYGDLQENLKQIEQSQSALRESEEKYRGLVELLPLVVFETDKQGRLNFANRNAFDTFGYPEESLSEGLFLYDLTIEADHIRFKANLDRVLERMDLGMMEYTGLRKDKSTFPCIVMATPIFMGQEPVGIRGIFIDITERKSLEVALWQAREFLDTILNAVADPIFVKDDQHRFILLNDAYCRLMSQHREKILGKTDYDFFPEDESDRAWEQDNLVFSSQKIHEREMTATYADGEIRSVLINKAAFKDTQGKNFLVGIIKDITDHKKMEQELFKSRKLKSIGILAGGIAHDFNNILTAIIGNLSLAKMATDLDSTFHRCMEESSKAVLRAKDLTQQLLTFSRGGAPVRQTVSLSKLIEESATFSLTGSKVRCNMDIADDLWPVDADEGQISQVIQNMMVNASQAMPKGGSVRICAINYIIQSSSPLPLDTGRYVNIVVKDNGVGIPPELLGDIFDPYFTTKEDGSGLGLATAFSIIKRHDGHIAVESTPGQGTTFSIYLPASEHEQVILPEKQSGLHPGQGKILIMDDEDSVREVIAEMLKMLGYTADTATDGVQALEKYQQARNNGDGFDLVIMDLTIPGGMGGQEAIKELLAIDPHALAIVASGYSSDPVMSNYKSHGFSGVISKPFEIEKLSRVLHDVLS